MELQATTPALATSKIANLLTFGFEMGTEMPCEIRERFIVKSEKEAYEQWLGDLIPTIKDYINQGIKIHVFKGEIVDISCSKRSLSMDEKVRVSYVGEKYLLCLNKLEEDKNASIEGIILYVLDDTGN